MIPKPLDQIDFADLQAIVDNVREGKTIEFKQAMPGKTDDEKKKFLRAVSSLANTAGGDLLIGVKAQQGLAKAIPGIPGDTIDDMQLRLSQLLATQLEPRLPKVDFHHVDCGENCRVLIIRVQRSWLAPHRIRIDNTFYGRNSAGNYPLDVSELRTAFTLSEAVADRIRKFRTDRLIKIAAGETPLRMHSVPALVIHVVPLSTFADGRNLNIVEEIANGHVMPLPPEGFGQPNDYGPNLDGFITFTNQPNGLARAYAQVFRTGAVEGVYLLPLDDAGIPFLASQTFENIIISALRNYFRFLNDIELPPPTFVFLSLCGVRGCHLRQQRAEYRESGYYNAGPLKEDVVTLPDVIIDTESTDLPSAMRLAFNTIWNAFGFPQSDKYNARGEWIGTG